MSIKIAVYGAGSIGCYVGGRLAQAGAEVCFIGRERMQKQLQEHGLSLSDYLGYEAKIPAAEIRYLQSWPDKQNFDALLICVKSAATAEVAAELADKLSPSTLVLSLQNGLSNAEVLRLAMPQHKVITGMVPFNVVQSGDGRFHQGSEGVLECQADPALATVLPIFQQAGLPLTEHSDMQAILWAKLLLNLNNAINALSDVPLKEELSQRDFRRCLSLAQTEALALMDEAGIVAARLTPLPAHWIPCLLTVPNVLFRLLANKMLAIDPKARSSMWEDLQLGRPTEIDYLNGEVIQLAARLGKTAPVNQCLVELIRQAEQGDRKSWAAAELLEKLKLAN